MHEELVHEEDREGYSVKLYFAEEYEAPDWDMSEEEHAELMRKIEYGALLWFAAHVVAEKDGYTGDDWIGGCCYESVKDFMTPGGYYGDMVNEAIRHCAEQRARAEQRRAFL